MKSCILPIILLCCYSAVAQDSLQHPKLTIQRPAGAKPWTNRPINDKPGQFQFAIVTDRTGGHRDGIFEDGVKKLNLLQPEFVMSVGDLIEGYTTDTLELNRQWDEFFGFVNDLTMPFFFVPGNHDLTNPVQEKLWEQRIGPKNYFFVYKDVLFMALNSEDQTRGSGKGSISQDQFEWIKNTLQNNQQVRWTFLFMHQPLWLQDTDPVKWFEVERLLADRPHNVFVGHRHQYVRFERNNSNYYMLATTGGGSALRGPQLGEFDHFVWVTMTERGPILANLRLEGIFDEYVHTEKISALTSKLSTADIIRVEPLYTEQPMFKKDSLRFRLTNSFDMPLTVRLSPSFSRHLKTDMMMQEITLPPNSVKFLALEMEARKPKAPADIDPVKIKAELRVNEVPNVRGELSIPMEFYVAPLPRYELKKTKGVTIDGKLNEWKLPYTMQTAEGAAFNVVYDDTNVYLAIQVNDSEVINPSGDPTFNLDLAGFVIDAQPLAKSVNDRGENWFAKSLYFIASPEDELGKNSVWNLGEQEKALQWKCMKNEKGFAFEIAVPLSYVQKLQGSNWQTLRVNVVTQDRDNNRARPERITWQPNWREGGNVAGSGMFFKK